MMDGEAIVRVAVGETRQEWRYRSSDANDRWPLDGTVNVEQIEAFAENLVNAILEEVFERIGEMRFR